MRSLICWRTLIPPGDWECLWYRVGREPLSVCVEGRWAGLKTDVISKGHLTTRLRPQTQQPRRDRGNTAHRPRRPGGRALSKLKMTVFSALLSVSKHNTERMVVCIAELPKWPASPLNSRWRGGSKRWLAVFSNARPAGSEIDTTTQLFIRTIVFVRIRWRVEEKKEVALHSEAAYFCTTCLSCVIGKGACVGQVKWNEWWQGGNADFTADNCKAQSFRGDQKQVCVLQYSALSTFW